MHADFSQLQQEMDEVCENFHVSTLLITCINYLLEIKSPGLSVEHFKYNNDRVLGLTFFWMKEGLP